MEIYFLKQFAFNISCDILIWNVDQEHNFQTQAQTKSVKKFVTVIL